MTEPCEICYLNGRFLPIEEARISPLDRGFLFADAVYEVIPVYRGRLFRAAQHFRRLTRSMEQLRMAGRRAEVWQRLCDELVERNGGGDLGLYLQVSRGAERGRNHLLPAGIEPTVFAMVSPLAAPAAETLEQGLSVVLLPDNRWGRCDIKATALLANVLLRQQAHDAAAAEAVLVRDGYLTEASASSVFVVRDGLLATPPNGEAILPGVTRDLVLELAGQMQITTREMPLPVEALAQASEVWIASSLREVLPVTRIGVRAVAGGQPGPLWRRVYTAFQEYKRRCAAAPAAPMPSAAS